MGELMGQEDYWRPRGGLDSDVQYAYLIEVRPIAGLFVIPEAVSCGTP